MKRDRHTYPARRKNNPPAGLEAHGVLQEARRIRYEYNPHLPPLCGPHRKPQRRTLCRNCFSKSCSAERKHFEMRFPIVEGYVVALRGV